LCARRLFWQVLIMCIASVFGTITLIGFCADLFNDLASKVGYDAPGETKSA
jgi:branched-subunit amino acid permease